VEVATGVGMIGLLSGVGDVVFDQDGGGTVGEAGAGFVSEDGVVHGAGGGSPEGWLNAAGVAAGGAFGVMAEGGFDARSMEDVAALQFGQLGVGGKRGGGGGGERESANSAVASRRVGDEKEGRIWKSRRRVREDSRSDVLFGFSRQLGPGRCHGLGGG